MSYIYNKHCDCYSKIASSVHDVFVIYDVRVLSPKRGKRFNDFILSVFHTGESIADTSTSSPDVAGPTSPSSRLDRSVPSPGLIASMDRYGTRYIVIGIMKLAGMLADAKRVSAAGFRNE